MRTSHTQVLSLPLMCCTVSEVDYAEFCIKNDEICIKNDEPFVQNDEIYIKSGETCIIRDNLVAYNKLANVNRQGTAIFD